MLPAIGFVLRTVGVAVAIDVPISPLLYSVNRLRGVFVFIAKRRHELTTLAAGAIEHRPILAEYTTELLDQMSVVVTASTLIAYGLYTFTAPTLPENHSMMITVPFVMYGIFRYMYLVHRHDAGGSPADVILKDKPLLIDVLLWLVASVAILTFFR